MSHEQLWDSDMRAEPQITVRAAEVPRSQNIDSSLSTASKWGDEPDTPQTDEYTLAIPFFPSLQDICTIPTEGWQG